MKPFDLEEAKSGKPVCTRDGREARIICFDKVNAYGYDIIALVKDKDGNEHVLAYNCDGECRGSSISTNVLVMKPEKEGGEA